MVQRITTASIIAGLIISATSAMAEGLADERNERDQPRFMSLLELSEAVSSSSHSAAHSIEEFELSYIGGSALEQHPELTAHQRKRLVFGSK